MSENINDRRAGHAAVALEAYREHVKCDDERTSMLDLITDLGHLARHSGIDFVQVIAQAMSVWAYERRHPDGAGASPQVTISIAGRRLKRAWPTRGAP